MIGSATSASYSPNVTTAGTFYYYVVATSSCSSATSNAVTVTVNPNTSITTQPVGFTVCAGGSGVISTTATGTGTVTYQWYSSTTNTNIGGTLIGSATSASYSPNATTAGTFYYYVWNHDRLA